MRCLHLVLAWPLVLLPQRALAQGADTSLYTPRGTARLGLAVTSMQRAASIGDSVWNQSGSVQGAELELWGATGGGLRARYAGGTIGKGGAAVDGKFETLDARFLLGVPGVAVVPGYQLRKVSWSGQRRVTHLAMIGLEVGRRLGGSGVYARGGATYLREPKEAKGDSLMLTGFEAHSSVVYFPPRLPVFVELGYRRDVLAYKRESLVARREENSGLILSLGVQTGMPAR